MQSGAINSFWFKTRDRLLRTIARVVLAAVVLGVTSFIIVPDAEARSKQCRRLDAQLANVGSGRRSSRVSKSARSQQRQLAKARSQMRRYACRAFPPPFFLNEHRACRRIRGTISRMQKNLSRLKSGSSRRNVAGERARIRRKMRSAGCNRAEAKAKAKPDRAKKELAPSVARELLRRRDRTKVKRASIRRKDGGTRRPPARSRYTGKTIRTMCVRMCDGFFFPISHSTAPGALKKDAEACANRCPGTATELFWHNTGEDAATTMISSVDRRPYTAFPIAFQFRKAFNRNCSCNHRLARETKPASPVATVAGREPQPGMLFRYALPLARPDRLSDPETAANARGGLTVDALGALNIAKPAITALNGRTKVREVGETFFPGQ